MGRRVRLARESKELSQRFVARSLADRLGQAFAQQQMHRVETGARELTARELVHLADVLGVDVDVLLAPGGDAGLFFDVQAADREVLACRGSLIDEAERLGRAEEHLSEALDRYAEADPEMDLSAQRERARQARANAAEVVAVLRGELA